jgi:hypothetical protein
MVQWFGVSVVACSDSVKVFHGDVVLGGGRGGRLREGLYTSLISEWRKQRDKGRAGRARRGQAARPPATRSPGPERHCCIRGDRVLAARLLV